jgi:ArsR family transcriptional regulator, arsenate/arsenite/antimonite-responsive transcriptional repressor / arsenate reductase (thioredoxin)
VTRVSLHALDGSAPVFLQLVADPQRWQLLRELARSDRRVGELTDLLGRPQNLVSYHLRELRDAGLVSARRSSADRRDIYYRVDLARCRDLLAAAGTALHPGLRLTFVSPEPEPRRRGRAPLVLFLCTGNSARSQMAEALLEHRSGRTVRARSAGSHPRALHPNAVRVLAERGIDISGRRSAHLRRFARTRFDRVITLCDKVREVCPEFTGPPLTAHWSMPDPAAEGDTDVASYPAFCRTAEELDARIDLLIGELVAQPTERNPHAR